MSKFLLTDCFVKVNGVELSDHSTQAEVNMARESVEVTGFNPSGAREFLPGLNTQTFTVNFLQDFASGKVDATLWPLYSGGSAFPIVVKPTSATASDTNPAYVGTVSLFNYSPIAGQINARSETSVTFNVTSGSVTRATTGY